MTDTPEQRLARLGIELAPYREPQSRYLPTLRSGRLMYFSGQLSAMAYDGVVEGITGQMGGGLDLETGVAAARACALGVLGRAKTALGELSRVRQVLRLTGYINITGSFRDTHKVLDGCSDVFMQAFGDAGRHTRLAIGVAGLSFDATVEVDCIFEVDEA